MRLFRRKTERPPAAACLVSLSPLQASENIGNPSSTTTATVGKSLSNDSIFKSSGAKRPESLLLKGTKNNKTATVDGSPKSPVKKGIILSQFSSLSLSISCQTSDDFFYSF
jgi:hypothetical protein